MRRHLLLLTFTLILSHFSISNLWAVDQDTWIDKGSSSYDKQFKWYSLPAITLPSSVVNIQNPWSTGWGIYVTFPESDFNQVYYNGTQKTDGTDFKIQGAGILFYITSLTAQNTVILIKKDNNTKYGLRIYNSAVTINAAGTELLYRYADGEYTSSSGSETSCAGTITNTNCIITGSDFYWSGRHSATVQKYDNTWTGVASNVKCCSRDEITFSASTYKISIVTKNTEGGTTRKLPKVQINGTNYSVQRVIVGGVSQSFSDNQWTYAGNTETTLEYDIDYSSSGSGTYHVSTVTDGGDKDKYLFKSLTITEDAAESVCPSAYSFHYGTNEQSDWTVACFENGSETDERVITDFTIPTVPDFYVGWEGNPLANNMTALHSWNDNVSDLGSGVMNGAMILSPVGGTSKVGWAQGAVGTLRCWYGSTSKNQYVSFQPNGYGITYGGNSYAFSTTATANMLETDVVTLPNVSTTYTMGIETATEGTYVTCAHSSAAEAISNMGVTVVGGGKKAIYLVPGSFNDAGAKYAVYDVTSGKFDTDFMSDSDGDGIYVGYVGSNCSTMILCRMNSDATTTDLANNNWDKRWNQTANIGISGDLAKKYTITDMNTWNACAYTTANMQPITGQKGKFRMWDNSGSQNWYVHWIPYYVLTYDSNGGSGTTAATERNSESSTLTVSVASNGFTAPTGKHFIGWAISQANADAGTVDYAAGASYTLTSNATLYAVWAWDTYTITYNAGTGVITGSHANDTKTYGVNLTLPGATFSKTGYTQTGWATTEGGSQAYALSGSYTENDAAELYPVWTAKTTTITIDANTSYHGSAGSSVTATWGQALPAFTAAEGESGYGLVGYYTGANDDIKIINADGTLVQNVTGYTSNDATPVWIYETSTLTLYPHYDPVYTVTVNVNNGSYGSAEADKASYFAGATVTITAAANIGYLFDEWTTSDAVSFASSTSAITTFTMPSSNVTVQANFDVNPCTNIYTIDCGSTANFVTPTGGYPLPSADDAGIHTGYYTNSHGSGYYDFKNSSNSEIYYTVHLPAAQYKFEVYTATSKNNQRLKVYRRTNGESGDIYYGGCYYSLMINIANGNNNNNTFGIGGTVADQNLAEEDYIIGLSSDETYAAYDQVVITANSNVFCQYTVSATATNGSVSGTGTYYQGEKVTLTATPSSGYEFDEWSTSDVTITGHESDNPLTFTMPGTNVSLTATFEASCTPHDITLTNDGHGSATASPTSACEDDEVEITATPNSGYRFHHWTTSDVTITGHESDNPLTLTMPDNAISVMANFEVVDNVLASGHANTLTGSWHDDAGSSLSGSNVDDGCVFSPNKVFKFTYSGFGGTGKYYGIDITKEAGYNSSLSANASGFGFYYKTETSDDGLAFCIDPKGDGQPMQHKLQLVATNGTWKYVYIAHSQANSWDGTFRIWLNSDDYATEGGAATTTQQASGNFYIANISATGVTAKSDIVLYDLTLTSDNSDGGSVDGDGSFYNCDEVTISATPESGYVFTEWKKGGSTVSTDAEYTFTMGDLNGNSDLALTAYFEYRITSLPWSGSVDLSKGVVITATPLTSALSHVNISYSGSGTVKYYDNTDRETELGTINDGDNIALTSDLRLHGIYLLCTSGTAMLTKAEEVITVASNETKAIPSSVSHLIINQGGSITNEGNVTISGSITYIRPAVGGAAGNKLGKWYSFCVPFTVNACKVYDEGDDADYDIKAVYLTGSEANENSPSGNGYFYLQYLQYDGEFDGHSSSIEPRWKYIGNNGIPQKNVPYIIKFLNATEDNGKGSALADYFTSNPTIKFVGGAQTISGSDGRQAHVENGSYYYYANQCLRTMNMSSVYVLDPETNNFEWDYGNGVTINPFEGYIQAVNSYAMVHPRIPIRGGGGSMPTDVAELEIDQSRPVELYDVYGRLCYSGIMPDNLPQGMWIVKQGAVVSKVIVP